VPPRGGSGKVQLGIAAPLLVVGLVILGLCVASLIRTNDGIEGDAVARGTLEAGAPATEVSFEVPDGDRRDYTVYIRSGGSDGRRELVVEGTACSATRPDGDVARFSGANQTFSATLGDASSIGEFSSPPGRVGVACELDGVGSRGVDSPLRGVPFVVTPGRPGSVLTDILGAIGGGVLVAIGMGLFVWGMVVRSKRPRPDPSASPA
jgi:hypothetical protein